jgi:hypothetical protein
MAQPGHFNRQAFCPFTAPCIKHAQPARRKVSASSTLQILPQNRLPQPPFGRAVNVARKLFGDVVEIAIVHRQHSTGSAWRPLAQSRYSGIPGGENEASLLQYRRKNFSATCLKKEPKHDAFYAEKISSAAC